MTAEDVDSHANGDILYSIVSGDRENQFFIEPITGQIKVNKQLDRETVRKTLFQMTQIREQPKTRRNQILHGRHLHMKAFNNRHGYRDSFIMKDSPCVCD